MNPYSRPFESGTVRLWQGSLDVTPARLAELATVLSGDELQRASGYRFEIHRNRFVAGRGFLREVLGAELGVPPESVKFRSNPFGKPELDGAYFNLAHSGSHLIIALAPAPVGVDIEVAHPFPDQAAVAREVFSNDELDRWAQLPVSEKSEAFFNLWTRKEALLKGLGEGITQHLQSVSVFFSNGDKVSVPDQLCAADWRIRTTIECGLHCSMSFQGEIPGVATFHLA